MSVTLMLLLAALSFNLEAKDYSKLFAKVDPAVVVITTVSTVVQNTRQGSTKVSAGSLGSGVIISDEGHIMTAAHVVENADKISIKLTNNTTYPGRVISSSKLTDLALIKIDAPPKDLHFVKPWDSDKVDIGEEVFLIGTPYGLEHTLTVGHLSGRRIEAGDDALVDVEFLQTDAAVNQGNSGGPMFNTDGKLIGIVSHIRSKSGGHEGLGFTASINMAKRVLLEDSPIWLGVDFVPLKGKLAKALNIPTFQGLLVQSVAKDSLGDALNLRAGSIPVKVQDIEFLLGGDIIIEIGGDDFYLTRKGLQRAKDYMQGVASGEMLQLSVMRDGKKVILEAEKP